MALIESDGPPLPDAPLRRPARASRKGGPSTFPSGSAKFTPC